MGVIAKIAGRRRQTGFKLIGSLLLVSPLTLGCLALSIGGKHYDHDCPTADVDRCVFQQYGNLRMGQGQELDVYYAVPYGATPNLEIKTEPGEFVILEQKPDHFRLRNTGFLGQARWEARGVLTAHPQIVAPSAPPTEQEPVSPAAPER
jgi:hypothetical protein